MTYDSSWLSDGTFWWHVTTKFYIPLAFKFYSLIFVFLLDSCYYSFFCSFFHCSKSFVEQLSLFIFKYEDVFSLNGWMIYIAQSSVHEGKRLELPTLTLRPECCSILSSCLQFTVYREKILLLWKDFVNPASYESINNSYMEQISIKFKEHNLSIPNTT